MLKLSRLQYPWACVPDTRYAGTDRTATATATGHQVHRYSTVPDGHSGTVAMAVAVRGFGPLGIDVEKQDFRTAWLTKGQKFYEKISNQVLPY